MSERAREFLDHWLSDHVSAVADTRRLRETVRLVTLCREDAIRAGLAPEELREASGGDLIGTMLVALSAAAAPATAPTSAEEGASAAAETDIDLASRRALETMPMIHNVIGIIRARRRRR